MASKEKLEIKFRYSYHDDLSDMGAVLYRLIASVESVYRSAVSYEVTISTDETVKVRLRDSATYADLTPTTCSVWLKDAAILKKLVNKALEKGEHLYKFQALRYLNLENNKLDDSDYSEKLSLLEKKARLYTMKRQVECLEQNIEIQQSKTVN